MRGGARTQAEVRARLHAHLQQRRSEIEDSILARVHGISNPSGTDVAYIEGLRASVSTAVEYTLRGIERDESHLPPLPPTLLFQARMAARNGVGLATVLRRYLAGYMILTDYLVEYVGGEPDGAELEGFINAQATLFDRLLAAVGEEYARETEGRIETSEQRRVECVRRLLAGELLDTVEFAYDLRSVHVGMVATGPEARRGLRELAAAVDRQILLVRPDETTAWAWLGGASPPAKCEVASFVSAHWPAEALLALGEPASGLAGWRLTHHQAVAALPVARRGGKRIVHYADVALLASALKDDLLATSLRSLYLVPLRGAPDLGEVGKATLRAYLAAGRNVSSAAAALGVSRRTVSNRLRDLEEQLGRSLDRGGPEIELALQLDELSEASLPGSS